VDLRTLHAQRWFAGKGRAVDDLSQTVDVGGLGVLDVRYSDGGGSERYLVHGDELRWGDLLRALHAGPLTSATGRLELARGPALDSLLGPAGAPERHASLDQSNTLVVVGTSLLVKAYRNLRGGAHPEVEAFAALAGSGAPVPRFAGSLVLTEDGGGQTTVALLQEYIAGAESGWEAMIAPVAAQLRDEREVALPSFAEAGAAAGVLHRVLAERLGAERAPEAGAGWHGEALLALQDARGLEPSLDERIAAALCGRLAPLARVDDPLVQRIHGDLNLAQCLFTPSGVLIVDFEGNPTMPLERRRIRDAPLRDVATLLRSIDHVGSAAARRAGGADPAPWIDRTRAATLAAYEREHGAAVDRSLLHALEIVAECRELVYAHRVVPEWAYVAQAGLARLLDAPVAPPTRSSAARL
jgi:maltokinase